MSNENQGNGKQKGLSLPKAFSSCPNCDSTKRLAQECAKHGNRPNPEMAALDIHMVPLQNPLVPTAVVVAFDVCLECGSYYATSINEQAVKIQAMPPV